MKQKIDHLLKGEAPLKAKQIASKLGLVRKDVNSFLYAHPEEYRQDSEYRWALIKGEELVLPGEWVTGDDFERIFKRAGNLLSSTSPNITITFSPRCKTMIDCIAKLL